MDVPHIYYHDAVYAFSNLLGFIGGYYKIIPLSYPYVIVPITYFLFSPLLIILICMSLFSSNHTKFPTPSHMHLIILCQAVSFVNPTEYNFQKQIVQFFTIFQLYQCIHLLFTLLSIHSFIHSSPKTAHRTRTVQVLLLYHLLSRKHQAGYSKPVSSSVK